jgi:formate-dependent nitrite reductase membrane component NrfD
VVPALLAGHDAFGFLAVWLGVTAGIYVGFALQDGRSVALRFL